MNYPANSNIAEVAVLNALATTSFVRPRTIDLYGTQLLEAANNLEDSYEHLNEVGVVADLPLTHTQIIDVLQARLTLLCEEYLRDVAHHARYDKTLKEMVERKVLAA